MVKNVELFKKMMMFSKELRMATINAAVSGGAETPMPGGPIAAMMRGKRPLPPMMDGEGRPPFPPKGFGKGPGGRGMNREHLLVIISEYPDGVRQKELAENAGINASSTSEVVSKLEDDGYLVREIDENDKRATILKLTEMGKVRADEIRTEREAFLDQLFGKLTDDEKQSLSDILDKLMEK